MATKKKAVKAKAAERPMKKYKDEPMPAGVQALLDKAYKDSKYPQPTAAEKKMMEDSAWASDRSVTTVYEGKPLLLYGFRYKGYKLVWLICRKKKATAKSHGLKIINLAQRNGDPIPEVNHAEVMPLFSKQMQEQFLATADMLLKQSNTKI